MSISAPVSAWISLIFLPLGPMTSPILSTGIWVVMMCGAAETARCAAPEASLDHVEDLHPGPLRLLERLREHVGRDAGELRVELERRDEVLRPGDLEVHVAVGVLRPEDVRERDVLAAFVDQTHRDAGDHVVDRNAGVHERQRRAADARHRRRAVRRQDLGHDAERVRELVLRRDHRQERTLGERTVADLAALRSAHEAGLPGRERREVVVVHVALGLLGIDRVDHLLHAHHRRALRSRAPASRRAGTVPFRARGAAA